MTSKPSAPVSSQGGIWRSRVSRLWRTTIRLAGLVLERDDVALAGTVAGDGHPLAVDEHVAVADQLAGLGPAGAPAGPEDDVVEAQLEHAEQVLAGDALLAVGLFVEVAELLLEHAVDAAGLLLLTQLGQVLGTLAIRSRPCSPGG